MHGLKFKPVVGVLFAPVLQKKKCKSFTGVTWNTDECKHEQWNTL